MFTKQKNKIGLISKAVQERWKFLSGERKSFFFFLLRRFHFLRAEDNGCPFDE